MIQALDERLTFYMNENEIDTKEIYMYYSKNPNASKDILDIFNMNSERDKRLVHALVELFGDEELKYSFGFKNCPEREDLLLVLYELYMNPVFSTLSLNWFAYKKECEKLMGEESTDINKDNSFMNKNVLSFHTSESIGEKSTVFNENNPTINRNVLLFHTSKEPKMGKAASGEKWQLINVDEKNIIEGIGIFSITGREVNDVKKTTFKFEFEKDCLSRKIAVEIKYKYKDDAEYKLLKFYSFNLSEGKTKIIETVELDYEKGFLVDLSVYEEK